MNPIILKYLPIALLVGSRDAQWILPSSSLPSGLPTDFDRNGLFQVAPADAQFVHTTHAHIEVAPGITKIAKRKLHVKRHQLPLVCAQVKTIHVAQGGGWPAVIADVRRPPRVQKPQRWLLTYVAFSRAETLDGLLLLRLCSREDLEVGAPQYLLEEIDRLLALETHSFDKLRTHIKNLRCKEPQFIQDLFSDACGSKPDSQLAMTRISVLQATLQARTQQHQLRHTTTRHKATSNMLLKKQPTHNKRRTRVARMATTRHLQTAAMCPDAP